MRLPRHISSTPRKGLLVWAACALLAVPAARAEEPPEPLGPRAPIPADSPRTMETWRGRVELWAMMNIQGAYARVGHTDPSWDKEVRAYLADFYATPTPDELEEAPYYIDRFEAGEALGRIGIGCRDPLLLLHQFRCLYEVNYHPYDDAFPVKLLDGVLEGLQRHGYSRWFEHEAAAFRAEIARRRAEFAADPPPGTPVRPGRAPIAASLWSRAARALAEAQSEPAFAGENMSLLARWMHLPPRLHARRAFLRDLLGRLEADPEADAWFRDVVRIRLARALAETEPPEPEVMRIESPDEPPADSAAGGGEPSVADSLRMLFGLHAPTDAAASDGDEERDVGTHADPGAPASGEDAVRSEPEDPVAYGLAAAERAWQAHPDRPEPAALAIRLARTPEEARTWFDRAVRARFDFPWAYAAYIDWLAGSPLPPPRESPYWMYNNPFGFDFAEASLDEASGLDAAPAGRRAGLVAFAEACVATGRFETTVPDWADTILRALAPADPRRFYRDERHFALLERLHEEKFRAVTTAPERRDWLGRHYEVLGFAGRYDRAAALAERLPEVDLPRATHNWRIQAFTDAEHGASLRAAEALELAGRRTAARDAYRAVAEAADPDRPPFWYASFHARHLTDRPVDPELWERCVRAVGSYRPDLSPAWLAEHPELLVYVDDEGRMLLFLAVEEYNDEAVQLLLRTGADPDARDLEGRTPLHHWPSRMIARMLLEAGARPDPVAGDGTTPLEHWASSGDWSMARLLLEYGADPNRGNAAEVPALINAMNYGEVEVVRLLLEHGASTEVASGSHGYKAIHWAVYKEQDTILRLLLEHGADPDARRTVDSWRPLPLAAYWGHTGQVRILLEAGVDPRLPLNDGRRPLDIAETRGHVEAARLIREAIDALGGE